MSDPTLVSARARRYADPHHCPDCRGPITAQAACPTCALPLRGPLAAQLFATLAAADDLLLRLRTEGVPAVAAGATPSPVAPVGPAPRRSRLSTATVPQVLLGLGAACLLVAALVFLAVTWTLLGLGGRTAVLVALTAVAAGVTAWSVRRGLRGAAEALAAVTAGLLTLDGLGAAHAGWFGALSTAGLVVALGAVLAAPGAAAAAATRRCRVGALVVPQLAVVAGTALVAAGVLTGPWLPASPALVLTTALAAAVAALAHRARLGVAAWGTAGLTALSWLSLTVVALTRVVAQPSWSALWGRLEVWPLLVAAAAAAATAAVPAVRAAHGAGRLVGPSVALLLLTAGALAPVLRLGASAQALVVAGVLAGCAGAVALLPRRRVTSGAVVVLPTQAVASLLALLAAGALGGSAAVRLAGLAEDPWAGRATDAPTGSGAAVAALPAPWLLPLLVTGLLVTLWSLSLAAGPAVRARLAGPAAGVLAASVLVAAGVAALALFPTPAWLLLAVLLVAAAALVAYALVPAGPAAGTALGAAAALDGAALVVGLHARPLTLAAALTTLLLAGAVHLGSRDARVAAVAGAVAATALAGTVWTAGALAGVGAPVSATVGLLLLAGLVLLTPYAPARWWRGRDLATAVLGLEIGAAAAAAVLGTAGVLLAPEGRQATWAALLLTLAGAAVTAVSLLRADRRRLAWAGGALLALATWVRLGDLGVTAPEAYTLPTALALGVVGLVHLRRHPGAGTARALTPGLLLALVPSLLWVLAAPTGLRALLLGAACLLLVLAGARLRWAAPLLVAAVVGALLVLRLAAPYVGDAVPRWVLLAGAGTLLVAVGATWERRLQEARQVTGYLRGLR